MLSRLLKGTVQFDERRPSKEEFGSVLAAASAGSQPDKILRSLRDLELKARASFGELGYAVFHDYPDFQPKGLNLLIAESLKRRVVWITSSAVSAFQCRFISGM
jgi:hypothetical protein